MTDIVTLFLFRNIAKSLLFLQKKVICITDEIRARDGCSASTRAGLFHVHGHACDVIKFIFNIPNDLHFTQFFFNLFMKICVRVRLSLTLLTIYNMTLNFELTG